MENRKALLVGINRYREPGNDLRGCVNDVEQVARLLGGRFGFPDSAVLRLTDGSATRGAILESLGWLVSGAGRGDSLVFHYSGHGSQVADRGGDEAGDGLDEILCPHDMDWDDPLTDDHLAAAFSTLPEGVHLAVILDCCHSGTALRAPAGTGPRATERFLAAPEGKTPPAPSSPRKPFGVSVCRTRGVLLAACRDDQTSADAFLDGDYHGAHSYFLCRALDAAGGRSTYRELVADASRALRAHRFAQVPQLEGPAGLLSAQAFGTRPVGGKREHSAA